MINYRKSSSISNYGNILPSFLVSFDIIQNDDSISYYVTDCFGDRIIKFNENWKYQTHSFNIKSPWDIKSINNSFLYVSSNDGLYKVDATLNVIQSYETSLKFYRGLYFNQTNGLLYAATLYNGIQVFGSNLNYIKTIFFSNNDKFLSLNGFNNQLYVGLASGNILIVENDLNSKKYNPSSYPVKSISIDQMGNLYLSCDNLIKVYNADLTYTNVSLFSEDAYKIGIDAMGRMIVITRNKIDIYH